VKLKIAEFIVQNEFFMSERELCRLPSVFHMSVQMTMSELEARNDAREWKRYYFAKNPVFTHRDFMTTIISRGRTRATANNLLALHLTSGRLCSGGIPACFGKRRM